MRRDKIGIATSLFKHNGYDEVDTVNFAEEYSVPTVQLYMHEALEYNNEKIDSLRQLFTEKQITMVVHSPHYLNKEVVDGHHTASLGKIFPDRQKRYVVVHYDERCSIQEALKACEDLNRAGLTVALENFYIGRTERDLVENINGYCSLIAEAIKKSCDIIPVIDFPRLFIEHFQEYSPEFLTKLILHKLSESTKDIILHMIDTTDAKQRREDWVPIGSGMIPYPEIFETLDHYNFNVISAILEFEEVDLGRDSIHYLQD